MNQIPFDSFPESHISMDLLRYIELLTYRYTTDVTNFFVRQHSVMPYTVSSKKIICDKLLKIFISRVGIFL